MQHYVLIGAAALFLLSVPVGFRACRGSRVGAAPLVPSSVPLPESGLDDRRLYDEPASEMRLFLE